MADLGAIGVKGHGGQQLKLAHDHAFPVTARRAPTVRCSSVMTPWRVLLYGGGVSLISKT